MPKPGKTFIDLNAVPSYAIHQPSTASRALPWRRAPSPLPQGRPARRGCPMRRGCSSRRRRSTRRRWPGTEPSRRGKSCRPRGLPDRAGRLAACGRHRPYTRGEPTRDGASKTPRSRSTPRPAEPWQAMHICRYTRPPRAMLRSVAASASGAPPPAIAHVTAALSRLALINWPACGTARPAASFRTERPRRRGLVGRFFARRAPYRHGKLGQDGPRVACGTARLAASFSY